ncbi:MAG TPA: RES family NAD+ phosphorylase [Candidatus Saccharimonadales bacterium]|nr:RES family NAD+ phosphorylase [Candidatus Saccharimonadales bacterium]
MARIADRVRPWSGEMLRHRPASSTRSVLDEEYLGQAQDNRWSRLGTRAYYFTTDIGAVVAEYGRHIAIELPEGRSERLARAVFRVPVTLARILDLTDPATIEAMGAKPIEEWILSPSATQAAAAYLLEQVPDLQGIRVPSVALLDHPDRANLVVYRDRIDLAMSFGEPVHLRDVVLEAPTVQRQRSARVLDTIRS